MSRHGQNIIAKIFRQYGFRLFRGGQLLLVLAAAACTTQNSLNISGFQKSQNPETVTVKRGRFNHILRLTGRVNAVESYGVQAPRLARQMSSSMIITKILPTGTRVEKGDILVEFDRQNQLKNVLDRQAEYDNLVHQINKKRADQVAALAADKTELKAAEVDLQTAKVEMRKNEVIPQNEAEINKENLKEAEARLKQLKDTFELKREAEAADLRILEIQRDRALQAATHEQSNIEKMTIRSPMKGLVVLTPMSKGSLRLDPEEGDEVRPGGGIMVVVNPSAMQVSAQLNQIDVSKVYVGQPAEIYLDAYPDRRFPGTVEHINAIGTRGDSSDRIRNFTTLVSIQGSDPKLLPDLTAAVDIRLETQDNVLLLPRNAVVFQEHRAWVQVLEKGEFEIREVQTGSANECEIVIESGIDEGSRVVLSPQFSLGVPPDRL